jgi:hypothetical protein
MPIPVDRAASSECGLASKRAQGKRIINNTLSKENVDHNQQNPAPDKIIYWPATERVQPSTLRVCLPHRVCFDATIAWKEDMSIQTGTAWDGLALAVATAPRPYAILRLRCQKWALFRK